MDLIDRTKPTEQAISSEWTPALRKQVLTDITTSPALVRSRRPWGVGVAASIAAGLMLAVPVALPGWVGRTAAAEELGRVADAAAQQPRLEWTDGQFLRVQSVETQTGAELTDDPTSTRSTRKVTYDDYRTVDGWTWSDRAVNGKAERYIFPPSWGWMRPDYAASMPTERHALDLFLRARALGSTSQDEAVFVAIGDMLKQEAAPPEVRAAAIGVLGLNPKVTVEQTADPQGRPALKVVFVDEAARPGVQQVLWLEPTTGVLLGTASTWPDGDYASVVTERAVVDALPADLVAVLGTEKAGKEVTDGVTTPIESDPGPDPVPMPSQSYTPAPPR